MSKFWTALFLYCSGWLCAFAQQPVRTVLPELEKRYNTRFVYLDSDIDSLSVVMPDVKLTLDETLGKLSQAGLDSEKIGNSVRLFRTPTLSISEPLHEVLVQGFLARAISRNTDGSFTVSPQKFGVLPGLTEADVLQTMQQLPGVMSVDETVANINVRGGTHDQNLFLWNGIRMFQTGHFFGLISAFSPSVPQHITIVKNGTSAFLGESTSSTVSIGSDTRKNSNFMLGANLVSADGYAQLRLSESASVTISARRSWTDLANTPTWQAYSDRMFQNTMVTDLETNSNVNYDVDTKFFFYDASVRYEQRIGKRHGFSLSAIGISNELDVTQRRRDSTGIRSRASNLGQRNFGASADWKTRRNARQHSEISAYFSHYNLDATNRSVENEQTLLQRNEISDFGLRLRHGIAFSDKFRFDFGYQYNETGVGNYDSVNAPGYLRRERQVMRNHAGVAEAVFGADPKKWQVKPGLRLNYFERFDRWFFEPRLQAAFAFSDAWRVEILGEAKSQTLAQVVDLQQDFLGLEKRRWVAANEANIPIQRSFQASAGVVYKKEGWLLSAEGFYKEVRGITSRGQAFRNQLEFEELRGDYSVIGTEGLAQKTFGRFRSWIGYALSRNSYDFSGYDPERFSSNFEILHSVTAASIYETEKLNLGLGARWFTGKPQTRPLSGENALSLGQIAYHDPNSDRLGDYFQLNFSATYKAEISRKTRLWAGVSILNVLGRDNVLERYYRVGDGVERVDVFSLGRVFNGSLRVGF